MSLESYLINAPVATRTCFVKTNTAVGLARPTAVRQHELSVGRVLHRGQCQQFFHFAVGQHDIRGALQRLIIAPLISVAEL